MKEQYIFYSTNCPKCQALKRLLDNKHINYLTVEDESTMIQLGMKSAPQLEKPDGTRLGFKEAFQFLMGLK